MKTISPLSILLLTAFTIAAQTIAGQSITTDELKARAKKLKIDKEIMIGYDKFKDQSGISTKPYNLIGGGEAFAASMAGALSRDTKSQLALLVNIFVTFPGQKLENAPDEFHLLFTSGSNDWLFLKGDRKAYFLIDKERLVLEPTDRDSDVTRAGVTEQLGYEISRNDLEKMIKAKTVEMRLGNSSPRVLKKELLTRFSKLYRLLDL
jgi:hypothetical protein